MGSSFVMTALATTATTLMFAEDQLQIAESRIASAPDQARNRYFRGVFEDKGLIKSIQIAYAALPAKPSRVRHVGVHIEQGCFTYSASGYIKGSRLVLLPVSVYLEDEEKTRELMIEWFGVEHLKRLDERGNLEFDIASLICHLDESREIQSVDIVLPDLTIYHARHDRKTPHDP
jgi:hypothetical protein